VDETAEKTDVGGGGTPLLLEGYISEPEYARQRGVSVRTCQRDRALRKSPPYLLLGKQVFYRIAAVRAWMLQHERAFEPEKRRRQASARRRA
jgi:hypothetical protein